MVLVRRLTLILFGLLVAAGAVFVGAYGYGLIRAMPSQDVVVAKGAAESILFASIVVASLFLLLVGIMIGRSIHVSRELEKLVEMSRYSGFSPETSLRRLGTLGERLNAVYRNANTVSEHKSVKISALSALSDFLVSNLPGPVMITDITGTIVETSRVLQERLELNRNELIGTSFHAAVAEPPWADVEAELVRMHGPVSRKTPAGEMTFYPIENRVDEIAYVVCSLDKPDRFRMLKRTDRGAGAAAGPGNAGRTGFRRLISTLRGQVGRQSH
jgi:PAS domain-containing protein